MGTAFDEFDQYAGRAYPGMLADRNHADVVTRLITDTNGVGFGVAVTDVGERSAEIPGAGEVPNGITVRETVRDNDATDTPEYPQGYEASVVRVGRVWVKAAGATKGQVYVVPDTGALTSSASGNLTFTGAKFVADAGSDDLVLVQLNGN